MMHVEHMKQHVLFGWTDVLSGLSKVPTIIVWITEFASINYHGNSWSINLAAVARGAEAEREVTVPSQYQECPALN